MVICTRASVITGRRVFHTVCTFFLALASAALLGVGWQGRFSSRKVYTHLLAQMASSRWWCFLFLQGAMLNTFSFRENIEGSDLFLRVHFGFCVSGISEEVPKLSENSMTVSARAGFSVPSNILRYICSCHWVSDHMTALVWWISCGIIVPCFPA